MKKILTVLILVAVVAALSGCTNTTSDSPFRFEVKGKVDKPGTLDLKDYQDKFITLNAKLDGDYTHLPAQDYSGVPLRLILSEAGVKPGATQVKVIASDGYVQVFDLSNVTSNDNLILIEEENAVRLVAKGYAGGAWVRYVTAVEVL